MVIPLMFNALYIDEFENCHLKYSWSTLISCGSETSREGRGGGGGVVKSIHFLKALFKTN